MTKICIYGAGAIGGIAGALLAKKGEADVSLIARGPHLAAIREKGLRIEGVAGNFTIKDIRATDNPADLGPQDYVIIALKTYSVAPILDQLQHLLHSETVVVTAQNGIPWWYCFGLEGALSNRRIPATDPGDLLWQGIGPERVIGAVIYQAAAIREPGVIDHMNGLRFLLGEPTGEITERAEQLSRLLQSAGLDAPVRPDIRSDIWVKLWGNLSFNPISALTGSTLDRITREPEVRALARQMMIEGQSIAEAFGTRFDIDVDTRLDQASKVGPHKTSMLVDLENGRQMEIDTLLTALQELAILADRKTPTIDVVATLLRQKARMLGLYPSGE
ncbi:MAG: 2-dehydropantoate 2-reductase [Sneathiella sp.]|uniref:2-dehydropantoate 2-reductase n=1 Tax=Sneathiella sp. TaxID=1964365 RepID=UPI000C635B61|nr:2-dehydropantoate 2-reductase [Sneathiella sp.]MAL77985.1 2-dehydropantoate 2-reductase [Sneathiella sp.]